MSNTLTPESRGRLVNLKTNLKSLRFGGDRPAGGSSNQPYIVKDIPEGTGYLRDGMPLQSGPDFILRDGFLAPVKAITDVSRLAKMFVDIKSPRGLFFTLKQNLLSRTNVKTQASFGAGYFGGAMNQGAYLPIGTLLDAGLGWAGIHLNKNGLNPVGSLGGPAGVNRGARGGAGALNPYSVVVKNDQEIGDNRLYNFNNFVSKGTSTSDDFFGGAFDDLLGAKFNINPEATEEDRDTPVLYSYGGGPGSILGVGKTNIFKERPTFNAIRNYQNLSLTSPRYSGVQPNGVSPLLYGDQFQTYINIELGSDQFLYPKSFSNYVIKRNPETFDDNTKEVVSKIIHKAPDYQKQNKALRTNLGDPGQHITYAVDGVNKTRNVFNYGIPAYEMEALDKITALRIYESPNVDTNLPVNDLVKFRIAVIKNGPSEGKNAQYVHFRAYISGFTDSYGATWNDVKYVGRGNSLKNYGGFTRDIGMNFTVFAASKAELIPMFTKLNFLASSLAPDYNAAGFMRGNMVRMTVGGYLHEVPGVLSSLSYTIPDDTTWEIGIDTEGETDPSVKELPHRIDVTLAFTPIQDFLPSRQTLTYEKGVLTAVGEQHFISLTNNTGNTDNGYTGDNSIINQGYITKTKTKNEETTDE
jgi:hypothetical protein|tara:strand:+ start:4157 stop:6073 length:1917 start_codon:yes stop_codon:yes gene_type:complete